MNSHVTSKAPAIMTGAVIVVVAWLASAGDLNPPPGPVAPTMLTLDDLNTAITSLGGAGCNEACQPAMSGLAQNGGVAEIGDLGLAFPIYDFSFSGAIADSACESLAPVEYSRVTITKDIDCLDSVQLLGALNSSSQIAQVRIDLIDGNDAISVTYLLQFARIAEVTHTQIERCDGTYQQLERVSFLFQSLSLECPGTSVSVNCN